MNAAPSAVDGQLAALRAAAARGDADALGEAAVQFEALFIGMMLKSARAASLGDGLFDGGDAQQYLEMMDAQVALDVASNGGFGFGRMLIEQLGGGPKAGVPPSSDAEPAALLRALERPAAPGQPSSLTAAPGAAAAGAAPRAHAAPAVVDPGAAPPAHVADAVAARAASRAAPFASVDGAASAAPGSGRQGASGAERERFVADLLPHAQRAAERLGVDPRLLIAQAALETGWGGAIPRRADGRSTHNLFGIKAGTSWRGEKASAWTLESIDGIPERRRAEFRAYASAAESFTDYASVIERVPRYADARRHAADPEAFAYALADAGYATDPDYASKWLAVYRSDAIAAVAPAKAAPLAQESPRQADNGSVTAALAASPAVSSGAAAGENEERVVTAWTD